MEPVIGVRAVQVTETSGPAAVRIAEISPPTPRDGELLVDVHAVGVSYPDLLLSRGQYQARPELPFVLGVDFAGVLRTGSARHGLASGDRVAGWSTHGSAAEVVAVPPERLVPLPDAVSFEAGAGMPLNFLTAHFALTVRAGVAAGEWVQVNGAAGGVGSAAVQLARALGCRVVAMVAAEPDVDFVAQFSPDAVIVGPSAQAVRDHTDGRGVDVVVDVVGSDDVVLESLRSLAVGGRFLSLGYVGGTIPSVRLNRLLLNNIDIRGVSWGPYTRAHEGFARRQWDDIVAMLEAGRLAAPRNRVRPLEDAVAALEDLAAGRSRGKTVLQVR